MQRRKFSREYKLEAAKLVRECGVSVAQAASELDAFRSRSVCRLSSLARLLNGFFSQA